MYKTWIVIAMALAVGCLGVVWYVDRSSRQPVQVNAEQFSRTPEQMRLDMQNRYVVIPPVGQLWAFTPDQKVDITVLQTKPENGGVVVCVRIASTAVVQPPKEDAPNQDIEIKSAVPLAGGKDSPKSPPPPPVALPVTVHLSGVVKLHYELIAGEWYLVDISSVNAQAIQK